MTHKAEGRLNNLPLRTRTKLKGNLSDYLRSNENSKKERIHLKKIIGPSREKTFFSSSWSEISLFHPSYSLPSHKCCYPHLTHEKLGHNRSKLFLKGHARFVWQSKNKIFTALKPSLFFLKAPAGWGIDFYSKSVLTTTINLSHDKGIRISPLQNMT